MSIRSGGQFGTLEPAVAAEAAPTKATPTLPVAAEAAPTKATPTHYLSRLKPPLRSGGLVAAGIHVDRRVYACVIIVANLILILNGHLRRDIEFMHRGKRQF